MVVYGQCLPKIVHDECANFARHLMYRLAFNYSIVVSVYSIASTSPPSTPSSSALQASI
jgi:hypothetical protein